MKAPVGVILRVLSFYCRAECPVSIAEFFPAEKWSFGNNKTTCYAGGWNCFSLQ